MAETLTTAVSDAIQTTLETYLRDKLPRFQPRDVFWHRNPDVIQASQCPAIGIFDMGFEKISETNRGVGTDGEPAPGIAIRAYRFYLDVFITGRKMDETREDLNRWTDAIVAVLEDRWDAGVVTMTVAAKAAEGSIVFTGQSATMMAARVTADIQTYTPQGSTLLTEA